MRKLFLLFLMLIPVALAGCLPQTQVGPTSTATAISRLAPTTTASVLNQANILPDSGCTVVTKVPTPGPTPTAVYPAVTEADWSKGPADAKVTIVEYGDYQ